MAVWGRRSGEGGDVVLDRYLKRSSWYQSEVAGFLIKNGVGLLQQQRVFRAAPRFSLISGFPACPVFLAVATCIRYCATRRSTCSVSVFLHLQDPHHYP